MKKDLAGSLSNAWTQDSDTKAWVVSDTSREGPGKPPYCRGHLDALAKANVPDTATFEMWSDTRDLAKGTHTLTEARAACDGIDRANKVKMFYQRALLAAGLRDRKLMEECQEAFKQLVADGVPPTERVPEKDSYVEGKKIRLTGTVEDVRKQHCDGGLAEFAAEQAKREAPFRAVLKNDKLDFVLEDIQVPTIPFDGYTIVGGKKTTDPKELAAAKVWFYGKGLTGDEYCKNHLKRRTVVRVVFDKNHKEVGRSEKAYCGDPPNAAFR